MRFADISKYTGSHQVCSSSKKSHTQRLMGNVDLEMPTRLDTVVTLGAQVPLISYYANTLRFTSGRHRRAC